MRRSLVLFAAGVLAAVPLASTASAALASHKLPSANPVSPAQFLVATIQDAEHQHSMRETSHVLQSDGSVVSFVTDIGLTEGIQRITYQKSGVVGHLTIEVVGGRAYFNGDSFSLVNFFGFTALSAAHIAGVWVSASPTDKAFPLIAADITLASAIHDIQVPGLVSTSAKSMTLTGLTHLDGAQVLGVRGQSATSSALLYFRTGAAPLPVAEEIATAQAGKKSTTIVAYSRWNEMVRVVKPKSSIALASLSAG